jgi:hypothetical protein
VLEVDQNGSQVTVCYLLVDGERALHPGCAMPVH